MGLISQHSISIYLAMQTCDLAVHVEKGGDCPLFLLHDERRMHASPLPSFQYAVAIVVMWYDE